MKLRILIIGAVTLADIVRGAILVQSVRGRDVVKMSRFYAQYWNDSAIVNLRGWRVYDRQLTYGTGDIMPIAQCWTRDAAFHIRDLLNAEEEGKGK